MVTDLSSYLNIRYYMYPCVLFIEGSQFSWDTCVMESYEVLLERGESEIELMLAAV